LTDIINKTIELLRIKRKIQADVTRYYATKNQHKHGYKMVMNTCIISNFP
jgi:predicted CoA-binding protein